MVADKSVSLALPSTAASVREARGFAVRVLTDWGLPEDSETVHTVRLIVSELATNAVLHTCGQSPTFTVCVHVNPGKTLIVGVTDSHPRFPRHPSPAEAEDNGRGMDIVRSLTTAHAGRLTVLPTEAGGKTVRVVLSWPSSPGGVRIGPVDEAGNTRVHTPAQ
ncbi:hypothetical protein SRB5_02520 [Streptomyces sp. RB5]|uniref:Histidine kinase/HSP90-like ATPase domain-containing protein n=1 Tax=Streptomyces smaragdinus TaxID=2585196 RepID=A0A7K0C9S7_9ACTN|nr:ATP-binding protein [Streptomyces smaragdinus]MQY10146.1 hypothetical protein [Streptomyces smaragdinus]